MVRTARRLEALRYGRLETCATDAAQESACSPDFQSAVSRISNPLALQVSERGEQLRTFYNAKRLGRATSDNEETINRDFLRKVERYLDTGAGACHLRRAEIGGLVAGAVKFFNEQRYVLREWVVMPNHVHVL